MTNPEPRAVLKFGKQHLERGLLWKHKQSFIASIKKRVCHNPQSVYTYTSYGYLSEKNPALVAHGFGTAHQIISRLTNPSTTHSASV